MVENLRFTDVSVRFFEIIFCPTGWFILKQLDNSLSLSIIVKHTEYIDGSKKFSYCTCMAEET